MQIVKKRKIEKKGDRAENEIMGKRIKSVKRGILWKIRKK